MLPTVRTSVDVGSVTIEFVHRGEWRSATCSRWGSDAHRNYHALVLAFESVRKADQRGIAGVFAEVASAFALAPAPSEAHQLLGLGASATEDEIRSAYRKRLISTHPDHGGDPVEFQKVRVAGEMLGVN